MVSNVWPLENLLAILALLPAKADVPCSPRTNIDWTSSLRKDSIIRSARNAANSSGPGTGAGRPAVIRPVILYFFGSPYSSASIAWMKCASIIWASSRPGAYPDQEVSGAARWRDDIYLNHCFHRRFSAFVTQGRYRRQPTPVHQPALHRLDDLDSVGRSGRISLPLR